MAKKKRAKAKSAHPYRKPYLDSGVFIAWIKGEKLPDGKGKEVDRGKIGEEILTQAESGEFPIVISSLTIAEVHKRKHKKKLSDDENKNTLLYFEHDFVAVQSVDRQIGEEANRLCRRHQDKKLSPADAIHLACAKRAGCDVLLSWDVPLTEVKEPGIKIETPRALGQKTLFSVSPAEGERDEEDKPEPPELPGGGDEPAEGPSATEGKAKAEESKNGDQPEQVSEGDEAAGAGNRVKQTDASSDDNQEPTQTDG